MPSRQTQQIMTNTMASRAEFREAIRLFLPDCKFRYLTEETIRGYHAHLHQLQLDLEKWNMEKAGNPEWSPFKKRVSKPFSII